MPRRHAAAPDNPSPDRNQARLGAGFAIAALLLSPVLGSVASALIIAAAVLGCFRLLSLRRSLALPGPAVLTGAAFAAFFLAEAVAGLINWNGLSTLGEIGENLTFLGFLPLFSMHASRRDELLEDVLAAAPWCAFAALGLALFQQFALDFRPQGGAGNSAVFAVTVAVLLAFNMANALTLRRPAEANARVAAAAVAGVLAASATLILSQTRALWPCLVIFPAILWLAARRGDGTRRAGRIAAVLFAATLATLLVLGGTIRERANEAIADFHALDAGDYTSSLGKRVVVWKVAAAAIVEHPLTGHGPDAPQRLMEERSMAVGGKVVAFSHFHNFVLNEMVRAGLLGLVALVSMFAVPLIAAASARRDATGTLGLGLLICLQSTLLLSGSVGIMLDHDIMDTQFLAGTAFCMYLIAGGAAGVAGGRAGDP